MNGVRTIVFDIGDVLIGWDPVRLYDAVIGPDRRKALFRDVDLHTMNARIDRGAPFRQTVYETAEAHPRYRDEIRIWHDRWIEMAGPAIHGSVQILEFLRQRDVPLLALSNFGRESLELADSRFPFLTWFDRRFVSAHLGCVKPEPEIYRLLEADCGCRPEELLFTDDRQENIEAATRRSWQAHHFTGPAGWARCLETHGFLSAAEVEAVSRG